MAYFRLTATKQASQEYAWEFQANEYAVASQMFKELATRDDISDCNLYICGTLVGDGELMFADKHEFLNNMRKAQMQQAGAFGLPPSLIRGS